MKSLFFLILLFFMNVEHAFSQSKTDKSLVDILNQNTDPVFQLVLKDLQTYRLQIIYTKIDRDKNNKPAFTHYFFNHNPELYFNPASMVKLPLAALALEKLNTLNKTGVNKFTTIQYDSGYEKQTSFYKDVSAPNEFPTIAHFIK